MTVPELIRQYERLRLDAERVGATAPLAKVYAAFIEELRSAGNVGGSERMMSTTEAASELGVEPKTIANWCADGRFPGAKKTSPRRGRWRIPSRDVYAFFGEKNGSSPPRLWTPEE